MKKKWMIGMMALTMAAVIGGCGSTGEQSKESTAVTQESDEIASTESTDAADVASKDAVAESTGEDAATGTPAEEIPTENSDDGAAGTETENTEASGIRPEFQEAMDSYEEFYDQYVAFMQKYAEADTVDAMSMMSDYTSYMEQCAEMNEKLEAIDEGEMTDEELAYYLEVTARIEQKLLSVAY